MADDDRINAHSLPDDKLHLLKRANRKTKGKGKGLAPKHVSMEVVRFSFQLLCLRDLQPV